MDEKIADAEKEVLVELVKFSQKRGMIGNKGSWKDFLNFYDKKLGSSLSDPSRRSTDTLITFLKSFTLHNDFNLFDKVLQCHSNRNAMVQFKNKSTDTESPEQKLVRLTLEHPQYPLDYSFPSHEEDWLATKRSTKSKVMKATAMVAVDCEMVQCVDNTEALVRVCVVDWNLQVKLNELVKPTTAVSDYRTEITGICAKDLDGVTCSLAHVQKSMKKLLKHGTILVGHSLNNDLQALKLDHARVVDTSYIFKYGDEPNYKRFSLDNLCKSVLGYELRKKDAPHNCLDDACAAMKLVLAKIERGVDSIIPLSREDVPEIETARLLIHRIPANVPIQELYRIIPGDFTIELKAKKRIQGDTYSALVIFKNQREANHTFENIDGNLEKDSNGWPQKLVNFQQSTGVSGSFCIRKSHADPVGQVASRKRSLVDKQTLVESKKLTIDRMNGEIGDDKADSNQCDCHMKEIERLNHELSQRDKEISNLNKIIIAITRKQGL